MNYLVLSRANRSEVGHRTLRAHPSFQAPNDAGGNVERPSTHAVAHTGAVGVVQVVLRLAEGQDRQRPDVGRLIPAGERALAEHVADRVD